MPPAPASADDGTPRTPLKDRRVSQLQLSNLMSTPIRISTDGSTGSKHIRDNLNPLLVKEVKDLSIYVSVDKWMSAVSGFPSETLAQWASAVKVHKFFEDPVISTELDTFCSAGELNRYVPLSNLLNRLLELVNEKRTTFKDLPAAMVVDDLTYFRHDPIYMEGPEEQGKLAAKRKPDIVAARVAEMIRRAGGEDVPRKGVPWNQAILCFELKHSAELVDKLKERRSTDRASGHTGETSSKVCNVSLS